MDDLDTVITGLRDIGGFIAGRIGFEQAKNFLRTIDTAIVLLKEQGAKTGHWIDTTKVICFPRVQCSVCCSGQGAIWMNHCPNCGAKMEGL